MEQHDYTEGMYLIWKKKNQVTRQSILTFTIRGGSNISRYFQGVYNSVPGHADTYACDFIYVSHASESVLSRHEHLRFSIQDNRYRNKLALNIPLAKQDYL